MAYEDDEPSAGRMTLIEHLTELRRRIIICAHRDRDRRDRRLHPLQPHPAAALGAVRGGDQGTQELPGGRLRSRRHRPARAVRPAAQDRHLQRARPRAAGRAVAALALHHPGPEPEGEALRGPVHPVVARSCSPRAPWWRGSPSRRRSTSSSRSVGADISTFFGADKYLTFISLMIVAFGLSFEFPVVLVFLMLARVLKTSTLRRYRRHAVVGDRGLRGGHHPEPGPLLVVLHGRADVPVLRRLDPDRKDVEAMSSPGARQRRRRQQYQSPRTRRELVGAVIAAVAIVGGTALDDLDAAPRWHRRPSASRQLAGRHHARRGGRHPVRDPAARLDREGRHARRARAARSVAILVVAVIAGVFWPHGLLRHTRTIPFTPQPTTPTTQTPAPGVTTTTVAGATTTTDRHHHHHDRARGYDHGADSADAVTTAAPRAEFEARRPFPLDDFQRRALDALDGGGSVIVAAPTGSGKTLVAEYAVALALHEGKKVFYTTPLKALSNQKYGDFGRELGAEQRRAAHRRQLDQRRGTGRGDDDRGAAQHDLRAVADARRAALRRPRRGALPAEPLPRRGVGGGHHPPPGVRRPRVPVGDGVERGGGRRLDPHGSRRHRPRSSRRRDPSS